MIAYFDNTPIYYKVEGKGPVIVLLHGFLLNSTYWRNLIPELLKKNQVLTIDLPGHGKSGCISEIHSMELMAEVVNFILEELKITSANFIGHSMGGYITLAFAEKYESKVKTIVLLNSTPLPDSPESKINRDRAIAVINNNSQIFIRMAITNLFPEKNQLRFSSEIEVLINEASFFPIKGITAAIKGMKNRIDRTSVLKSFEGNKYLICGEEDPIVHFSIVKKAAKISNTTLIKVKSGHMSLIENMDEIVKIVHFIDFL